MRSPVGVVGSDRGRRVDWGQSTGQGDSTSLGQLQVDSWGRGIEGDIEG